MIAAVAHDPPVVLSRAWRTALVRLAVVWAALLLLFAGDVADLIGVWTADKTYNHCLLVLPIAGALVWLRRRELARLKPAIWRAPLLWIGAASVLWLLGELGGVGQFRQLALVGLLQGTAALCLGRQVTRGLLFPLAWLVFLVPFGAELVPPLQRLTAHMAMSLLNLTSIPATMDGVFITTPAGWFEVAEACSGISFLIATVAWGALAANLLFRSAGRRTAMMVACVVLPILANGVRAWATIAAAEWVGTARASGFDHIVYGWIFFALVLAVLFAGAWRWFERSVDDPHFDPERLARLVPGDGGPVVLAAGLLLPLAAFGWAVLAMGVGDRPMPRPIDLPVVPGWSRVAAEGDPAPWTPRYDGGDHYLSGRYRDPAGRTVDLAIVLFRSQGEGHEVAGYGQGAIPPGGEWNWARDSAALAGAKGQRMLGPHGVHRTAWTTGVVGGRMSGNAVGLKLLTLGTRLRLGDPAAGALIVSAPGPDGQADAALADFLRAVGPPDRTIERLIATARGR